MSQPLNTIYQEYAAYVNAGSSGTFSSSEAKYVMLSGTNVGVQVHFNNTGAFSAFITQLQNDRLQVIDSSSTFGIVEGMLPISELPNVAQLSQVLSLTPMYNPQIT